MPTENTISILAIMYLCLIHEDGPCTDGGTCATWTEKTDPIWGIAKDMYNFWVKVDKSDFLNTLLLFKKQPPTTAALSITS